MTTLTDPTTLARDWNRVRAAFATSIMVDTPLASLAPDMDGRPWPLSGPDETPAAYLDFDYDVVVEMLALRGQPAVRVADLINLLQGTLAFDDPFGEMVEHRTQQAERDNPIRRNLAKLGIPESFPIALCTLEPSTHEFCRLEGLAKLEEFAVFTQGMARNVTMGGDFKASLSALSHIDEQVIARLLPYRPGTPGLHLIKGVRLAGRAAPDNARGALGEAVVVRARVQSLIHHFGEQVEALRERLAQGESWARLVAVLNDAELEPVVADLLRPHLSPEESPPPQRSWWRRWFNR